MTEWWIGFICGVVALNVVEALVVLVIIIVWRYRDKKAAAEAVSRIPVRLERDCSGTGPDLFV